MKDKPETEREYIEKRLKWGFKLDANDVYFFLIGIARRDFTESQWEEAGDLIQAHCRMKAEALATAAVEDIDLAQAVRDLANYHPEYKEDIKGVLKANSKRWGGGWYTQSDEECPFFSEGLLYPLQRGSALPASARVCSTRFSGKTTLVPSSI